MQLCSLNSTKLKTDWNNNRRAAVVVLVDSRLLVAIVASLALDIWLACSSLAGQVHWA